MYDFYEEENHFRCTLMNSCNKPCQERLTKLKTGGITQNLKRHLKRKHEKEHMQVEEADKNSNSKKSKPASSSTGQTTLSGFIQISKLKATMSISKEDYISSILKMVCYNGVPLTFFSDQGFKLLNGKLAQNLGAVLGRDSIRQLILEKVHIEKQMLSSAVKHELVFIKFDDVTRLRSHYLGINIQYFDKENGITTVKCLELVNTDAKHDSSHMKNLIIKTLTQFDISKSNVLGAVVDNASNMTKAIQLLNEDEDYSKEELDNDGTFQKATMNNTVLRDAIVNSFDATVHHMRSAEHTLQQML